MLAQEGEVHPKYGKRKKNHLIDLQKNKNKDLEDYKNQLAMKAFFQRQYDATLENVNAHKNKYGLD